MRALLFTVAACLCIGVAMRHLLESRAGLEITRTSVGATPVTTFRLAGAAPAPVVVIAHGFAGSQPLMQAFAVTLARNGYVAVTFDFPGHGRSTQPLSGGLDDVDAMQRDLLDTLDKVVAFAARVPGSDGRVGLLGHSMAADIVVRYADRHPDVRGTVAVSLFLPSAEAFHPRNLLIVDGALEAGMLKDQALAIVAGDIGEQPSPGVTYGRFDEGVARRVAFARDVEHIGVLYSADSLREALAWFDASFERSGGGFIDARGGWLGLLFLGIVALARPLSALLPSVAAAGQAQPLRWRTFLSIALAPAILTPLILRVLPTSFLPILLGDYLACHLALYGVLTALFSVALRGRDATTTPMRTDRVKFVVAVVAVTAYSLLAVGLPLDAFVVSAVPPAPRVPLIGAMLLGTLPYFLADEWLVRRLAPRRGAYATTKACLVLSLVIAIVLDPQRLFFLAIIVPAIAVLFVVYGLFSAWVGRRTRQPLVAASANALVFAWFIAVTFPLVSR
ncbi:MAG TPA: alpha/beta fold hydrolase [Rhodanobacteraceae bacterium]